MKRFCFEEPGGEHFTMDSFRYICTVSPEAKSMLFYLNEVAKVKGKSEYSFSNENLNSYQLGVVLNGKGLLKYKEHTFHLNKGVCFFIDCIDYHEFFMDKNDPCEIICIHFSGVSAQHYYKMFDSSYVNVVRPKDIKPFERVMNEIAEININHEPYTELITSKLITDLLTMLITFRSKESIENPKLIEVMTEIRNYIDNHFNEEIYLEVLAEKFRVNKFNITRDFKRVFGVTISKYILSRRLSYSKHLLRYTNKSIEEISEICGFYDTSYFNKQFKTSEDITPLKYRKSWMVR